MSMQLSVTHSRDVFRLSVGPLFFSAFIVGVFVKLILGPVVTIGYDDYRLVSAYRAISLAASQEKVLSAGGSFASVQGRGAGPACTDSEE